MSAKNAAAEIAQLYVKGQVCRTNNGAQQTYAVHMKTYDHKDKKLVPNLMHEDHALYIEQQIERHLGISDTAVPGEVER